MPRESKRPALRRLAERVGIVPQYIDATGRRRVARDETCMVILSSLGYDASSERSARAELPSLDAADGDEILPSVRVAVEKPGQRLSVRARLPGLRSGRLEWTLEISNESGERVIRLGGRRSAARTRFLSARLPDRLAPGYYTVNVEFSCGGQTRSARQTLIVAPRRCLTVGDVLGDRRGFGLWANLYSMRRRRSWGVGDLADLNRLAAWAGTQGADFVGVNPLHAVDYADDRVSPYSPSTRLFRNPIYIDVEAVPEFRSALRCGANPVSPTQRRRVAAFDHAAYIEYPEVIQSKMRVLRRLHRVFLREHAEAPTSRGRAYRKYVAGAEPSLTDFATYRALRERFTGGTRAVQSHHRWPAALRDVSSPEVQRFRSAHAAEVAFHRYLQFELDRQLASANSKARRAGLTFGIYNDVAVGSDRDGFDTWAYPSLFVGGVSMGCPPDAFSDVGQNWRFPPINPRELIRSGYAYWIRCLRSAMAGAGMVRLDHVMGLFRQFWIPKGFDAVDGAYVRFPADDLLAILALESQRHGAVVVGEDLGTVPRGFPRLLKRWGLLSTRVLQFERRKSGAFKPARAYPRNALVMATTHDHPTLAAFATGRDLDVRREHRLIASKAEFTAAQVERTADRLALHRRIKPYIADPEKSSGAAAQAMLSGDGEAEINALCVGVHAFLAETPCPLLGVGLDDLASETEPVNIPGTDSTQFPNWRRRMLRSIEEITTDETAGDILTIVRQRRLRPPVAHRLHD